MFVLRDLKKTGERDAATSSVFGYEKEIALAGLRREGEGQYIEVISC